MLAFFNLFRLGISSLKGLWTLLFDAKIWVGILAIAFIVTYTKYSNTSRELVAAEQQALVLANTIASNQVVQTKIIYRERATVKKLEEFKDERALDKEANDWGAITIPSGERSRLQRIWDTRATGSYTRGTISTVLIAESSPN